MKTSHIAFAFAFTFLAGQAPAADPVPDGEPLPAGAPTAPYALTAWCYGALSEYLDIYQQVIPDLRDMDRMFGTSVKHEAQPYAQDIAAAGDELKVLAGAVSAAEQASPTAIAPDGVAAIKLGRSVWAPVKSKTTRELARAWMTWALPDKCDATARDLASRSALLGQAMKH